MKWLKFIMISSLAANSLSAIGPSLSSKSKERIAASSIKGGLTGLGLTGLFAIIDSVGPAPTTKQKLKEWTIIGVALTTVGALIGGISEYFSVPEKRFSNAKEQLSLISQDSLIGMLYQTKSEDWITIVKRYFARSRFPLMAAFSNLTAQYDRIMRTNGSLNYAFASDNETLRQEGQELQNYAETTLTLIQGVLSKITADPNYISECTAKAQEDGANALTQMAITQQIILANELNREIRSRSQKVN